MRFERQIVLNDKEKQTIFKGKSKIFIFIIFVFVFVCLCKYVTHVAALSQHL